MVKITMDGDLQRTLQIADKIRAEFSDVMIVWGINTQTDNDLTLSDLSMYVAGQMDGWIQQLNHGTLTMGDIAEYIDATIDEIRDLHAFWGMYDMAQRKGAIKNILIAGAERAAEKGE